MRPLAMAALGVIAMFVPPTVRLNVALSSTRAGATDVRAQLNEHTLLQCGRPSPGPVTVILPAAEKLQGRPIVRLDGRRIAARVAGRRISFTVPPPSGVSCDLVGPGSFTVTVAPLRNPGPAGAYRFSLVYQGRAATATAHIREAA